MIGPRSAAADPPALRPLRSARQTSSSPTRWLGSAGGRAATCPAWCVTDLVGERVEDVELERGTASSGSAADFVQVRWFPGGRSPASRSRVTVSGGSEDAQPPRRRRPSPSGSCSRASSARSGRPSSPLARSRATWQLERSDGRWGTDRGRRAGVHVRSTARRPGPTAATRFAGAYARRQCRRRRPRGGDLHGRHVDRRRLPDEPDRAGRSQQVMGADAGRRLHRR